MTGTERERLIESMARALLWTAPSTLEHEKANYRRRARSMLDEMEREANPGNAIHLRRAIADLVREDGAA